jgi:hypothetical protein
LIVPAILCYGLGLFIFSIAAQILIWRSFPVKNQPVRLAIIFVALPACTVAIWLAISSSGASVLPRMSWPAWCLAYLLDLSVSISYMLLYTAVASFSPSIAILERVEEVMPAGLPREQLVPLWFTDQNLSAARHENLLDSRLVTNNIRGELSLEPRGRFIARCFLVYRRFLGLPDLAKG